MAETKYPEVEFLEFVVKAIVDHPEDVEVKRTVDEQGVLLTLGVNPRDMGQVIGRAGKTIDKAIRPLARLVGVKNSARVNVKLLEPEGSERPVKREEREASSADGGEEETAPPISSTVGQVIDDIKKDL